MRRTDLCGKWEFSRGDGAIEAVVVPHDAMLGAKRGPDAPAGSVTGYYFGGTYRYRKEFTLDADAAAGTVMLEFEGVYRDAAVCVNGHAVEVPPNGFIPFFADCTGLVVDGTNVIEVECGVLLAFGSAQPAPTERFIDGAYTTYRGRAMAIVHRDEPGTAKLTISGETLAVTSVDISFT